MAGNNSSSNLPFTGHVSPVWSYYCPEIHNLQHSISAANATVSQVASALWLCAGRIFSDSTSFYETFDTYQALILGVLGFAGNVFAFLTLSKTRSVYFKASTYRYFRILAIIQASVMLALIHSALRRLLHNVDQQYYGWFFVSTYVELSVNLICATWADLIICFLSFERAAACLVPWLYQKIQKKPVFFVVITVTLSAAFLCDLSQAVAQSIVYKTQTRSYATRRSMSRAILFFDRFRITFTAIKCALLIISTTAAVVGFAKAHRVKRRIHQAPSNVGGGGDRPMVPQRSGQLEWRVTTQLCVLQIAQAIPTLANAMTLSIGSFVLLTAPLLDYQHLAASSDLRIRAYVSAVRGYFAILGFFNATKSFGHCVHPYLYLVFSRPFRKAAREVTLGAIPMCLRTPHNVFSINGRTPALAPLTGGGVPKSQKPVPPQLIQVVDANLLSPKTAWELQQGASGGGRLASKPCLKI